jgi:hypothetical protein
MRNCSDQPVIRVDSLVPALCQFCLVAGLLQFHLKGTPVFLSLFPDLLGSFDGRLPALLQRHGFW